MSILTERQRLSCRGGKTKTRAEYIKEKLREEIVYKTSLWSPRSQDANGIVGNQTKYMRAQNTFEHVSFPISNIKNTDEQNFEISKKVSNPKGWDIAGSN